MKYPNVKLAMKSKSANGDTINTTIGYCNPNATDGVLTEFAKKLNEFTSNTFVSITKVETTDVTNSEYAPYTLEFSEDSDVNYSAVGTSNTVTFYSTAPDTVTWDVENLSQTDSVRVSSVNYSAGTGTFTVATMQQVKQSQFPVSVKVVGKSGGEQVTPAKTITGTANISFDYTISANPTNFELTQTGSDNGVQVTFNFTPNVDSTTATLQINTNSADALDYKEDSIDYTAGTAKYTIYALQGRTKVATVDCRIVVKPNGKQLSNYIALTIDNKTGGNA